MKTIAVMTMLFLPGTFYAAVFALPTLRWNTQEPRVVQPEFWIFWAFTIPSTIIVLLTSVLMHNHKKTMALVQGTWAAVCKSAVRASRAPRIPPTNTGRGRERDTAQTLSENIEGVV